MLTILQLLACNCQKYFQQLWEEKWQAVLLDYQFWFKKICLQESNTGFNSSIWETNLEE